MRPWALAFNNCTTSSPSTLFRSTSAASAFIALGILAGGNILSAAAAAGLLTSGDAGCRLAEAAAVVRAACSRQRRGAAAAAAAAAGEALRRRIERQARPKWPERVCMVVEVQVLPTCCVVHGVEWGRRIRGAAAVAAASTMCSPPRNRNTPTSPSDTRRLPHAPSIRVI